MAFRMRKSKFRHIFGKGLPRDQCYDNIRVTRTSWEATFCAVNPKWLAVITEAAGGGAFLVHLLTKTGRLEMDTPLVAGHKAAVLDIAFCPHNDDVIASGGEDCIIKVWQLPENGLTVPLTESVVDLVAHRRRVGFLLWHPNAANILLSSGSDNMVIIWNVGAGAIIMRFELPDICLSASFNWLGDKFVSSCKDRMLRVHDARTGEILKEGSGHTGSKPTQVIYTKSGRIFTTGFSKRAERQYALWDENDLSSPLTREDIDQSNGTLFPFYDQDTDVIYLCGKGDSQIRYYEITPDDSPYVHYLDMNLTSDPQRGIAMMCKRGVDVNKTEITRFYKLHNNGLCEVVQFFVPRKLDQFHDDLYPDTPSDVPALSADEWVAGKNSPPILVSLKDGFRVDSDDRAPSKVGVLTSANNRKSAFVSSVPDAADLEITESTIEKRGDASSAPVLRNTTFRNTIHSSAPVPSDSDTIEEARKVGGVAGTKAAEGIALQMKKDIEASVKTTAENVARSVAEEIATSVLKDHSPSPATSSSLPASEASSVTDIPEDFNFKSVMEDMKKLKMIVKAHERRFRNLEERLTQYEDCQLSADDV